MALARYRWAFQFDGACLVGGRFQAERLAKATVISRIVYWSAALLTVATLVQWRWWRL